MLSPNHFQLLIEKMEEFLDLSIPFKRFLNPLLESIPASQDQYLLKTGEIQTCVWFILSGSAMATTIDANSKKELINWFWKAGDFVFNTPGFFSQQPSKSNIILREDSLLVELEFQNFSHLKSQFPEAERVSEIIRDHYQQLSDDRIYELANWSAEQRYQKFKKDYKEILYSTIQIKLAAFLGMTYKTFSRLHRKR